MSRSSFREVYDGAASVLPELPLVGWTRSSRARWGVAPHVHEKAFEIFFMERGEAEWRVKNEPHTVAANHVFVNRPGELHGSTGRNLHPCGYFRIQVVFGKKGLPGLPARTSAAIRRELMGLRQRIFPASESLKECFVRLLELHRGEPPWQGLCVRAALHLLLGRLLSDYRESLAIPPEEARPHSYAIRKALRAISAQPQEIQSVTQLARLTRLGVTQFSERFFLETGFSPATYLRRQRIELAKSLLRSGTRSITEIAQETAFSSSQHFSTVFKQLEGCTPGGFARLHRGDAA